MMSLNQDLSTLDPVEAAQEAYDGSARNRFQASSLHPWTIARHSVAMTLGCRLITAVGPFVAEFIAEGNYSNVLRDVIIVLWLSSRDDKEVIAIDRAEVGESMAHAYAWAAEQGIEYGGPAYLEGIQLLDRILKQILASFFEVEQAGGAEVKKKDIAPPGRSRLLMRLQKQVEKPRLSSFIKCHWRRLCNGKPSTFKASQNSGFAEELLTMNEKKKNES